MAAPHADQNIPHRVTAVWALKPSPEQARFPRMPDKGHVRFGSGADSFDLALALQIM
jgi:hypothetical protein